MTFLMPRYPKVAMLRDCPEIYAVKEVVAYEKLHGSNFRIGFPPGMQSLTELCYGSRETEQGKDGGAFPLGRVVNEFQKPEGQKLLGALLETFRSYGFSEVTVFGEAYGPGIKAKGVRYSTGQEPLFRAFDIMVAQNLVTDALLREVAGKAGLPLVPEVWRGAPTPEAFDALLEQPSHVARDAGIDDPKNIAEGVVIRSSPLLRNVFGDWLICKHKSAAFEEVASAPVEKKKGDSPADGFAATYVTIGRISNAIGRLHDRGTPLAGAMTDMPRLLDEIHADLLREALADYQATGAFAGQMRGAISKVLAQRYREMLAQGAS
jgi:hypothetical protein